jgi:hypothetical protein
MLVGSAVYYRTVATGVFHCERCGGDRPYRHRSGWRWLRVLGLPVLPRGRTGEHLQCSICRTCYRVELLAVPTIEQMQVALLAATTAATLALLWAGGSASSLARHRAIELIVSAGARQYSEAELALALDSSDLAMERGFACGPVPGLRNAVETFAIQLDRYAKEWFLGKIIQVGLADGQLSDTERAMVGTVARYLGLSQVQASDVIALTEEAAQAG